MKQEVRFEVSMSVDATKAKEQIEEFVSNVIIGIEDWKIGYSNFKVVSIKEEAEIYETESAEIKEVVYPFVNFKVLPHKSKRKFRVEETMRELVEYYYMADIEIYFSDEEDSNDLELIAFKIKNAKDEQKSNTEEDKNYYELDSKQGIFGLKRGDYTLDDVVELEIEKEPTELDILAEKLEKFHILDKEKAALTARLKELTNDFAFHDRQIEWHKDGSKEWVLLGVGRYIEGINEEQDNKTAFWVDSLDEIEVGCDLGDFKIVKK
jgi:hypothetical protein